MKHHGRALSGLCAVMIATLSSGCITPDPPPRDGLYATAAYRAWLAHRYVLTTAVRSLGRGPTHVVVSIQDISRDRDPSMVRVIADVLTLDRGALTLDGVYPLGRDYTKEQSEILRRAQTPFRTVTMQFANPFLERSEDDPAAWRLVIPLDETARKMVLGGSSVVIDLEAGPPYRE